MFCLLLCLALRFRSLGLLRSVFPYPYSILRGANLAHSTRDEAIHGKTHFV